MRRDNPPGGGEFGRPLVDRAVASFQQLSKLQYACPHCGAVTRNPNDAKHRYCGRCCRYGDQG